MNFPEWINLILRFKEPIKSQKINKNSSSRHTMNTKMLTLFEFKEEKEI